MSDYLRPSEILEIIPNCPFSESQLGTLLSLKLIKGKHRNRLTLICLDSLKKIIEYRNQLISSEIIIIDK